MSHKPKSFLHKYLSLGLAALLVISASSWPAAAETRLLNGAATAAAAAAPETLLAARTAGAAGSSRFFSSSQPDSTAPVGGYFEEEEENKNLYRDIGVFLIVSAFVGYFIIKVFLQGETEEPPSDGGGKEVPNPFAFKLTF